MNDTIKYAKKLIATKGRCSSDPRAHELAEALLAEHDAPRVVGRPDYDSFGYALAMEVLQSVAYRDLPERARAECDELIRRGQEGSAKARDASRAESTASPTNASPPVGRVRCPKDSGCSGTGEIVTFTGTHPCPRCRPSYSELERERDTWKELATNAEAKLAGLEPKMAEHPCAFNGGTCALQLCLMRGECVAKLADAKAADVQPKGEEQ